MFITTAHNCSFEIEHKAKELAEEFAYKYINRKNYSLSQLKRDVGDREVVVVEDKGLKFVGQDDLVFFFHPNLAKIRITSLLKGFSDRLWKISRVESGHTVLDCTMGLATDSIVFSFLVGEKGKVIALESETVPYLLGREGLRNYNSGVAEIDSAMRRISSIHEDHLEYMKSLPDKSFDIVYFDPMFRRPTNTIALTPLRSIANNFAIKTEAIIEAKRIARKKVILKERKESGEFERLGFELIVNKKGSSFDYGVIES